VHWHEQKQPDASFILKEILACTDEMCYDADEEVLPKCNNDEMDAESEDEDMNGVEVDEDIDGAEVDEDIDGVEVDAAAEETSAHDYSFKLRVPPSINDAHEALQDLKLLLKPTHDKNIAGSVILSPVLKERLTQVKNFLWLYTDTHDDGTTHPANPVGSHWSQAAD
jgi:hypothetical protein